MNRSDGGYLGKARDVRVNQLSNRFMTCVSEQSKLQARAQQSFGCITVGQEFRDTVIPNTVG